jgi:hypothetical protein
MHLVRSGWKTTPTTMYHEVQYLLVSFSTVYLHLASVVSYLLSVPYIVSTSAWSSVYFTRVTV